MARRTGEMGRGGALVVGVSRVFEEVRMLRGVMPDLKKIHAVINMFGANLPLRRNFQRAFGANRRLRRKFRRAFGANG